jgi:hypothetical protein
MILAPPIPEPVGAAAQRFLQDLQLLLIPRILARSSHAARPRGPAPERDTRDTDHSPRSATAGSIRVARQAGPAIDTTGVSASTIVTDANVAGSRGSV